MSNLHLELKKWFGYEHFLEGQEEVVQRVVEGQNVVVIMPTGAGKSLCYQLPVLMQNGYGLVVSPLISLMKDQVDALNTRNIPAAYLNSTLSSAEQGAVCGRVVRQEVKLLYVAPERFKVSSFQTFLQNYPPLCLIVDEAHCISQWGHDFRPDYLKIGNLSATVNIPQVCAFTATATPMVRDDITTNLKKDNFELFVIGFQRPNLSLKIINCGSKDIKNDNLKKYLRKKDLPTIVYAATRKDVDALAFEYNLVPYHAGMNKDERTKAQDYFMNDQCPRIVATNAFGMGIDRPDIRRVIHYSPPGSLEAYYQEAGRAGRDGEPAECILFSTYQDKKIQEFLIDVNNPEFKTIETVYKCLYNHVNKSGLNRIEWTYAEIAGKIGTLNDKEVGSAVRVLEKHNYIEHGYRRDNQGFIRFLKPVQDIVVMNQQQQTQRARFLYRVAKHAGDMLETGVMCTTWQLEQICGLSHQQVQRVLNALNGNEIEWRKPFTGRCLVLTDMTRSKLEFSHKELDKKRNMDLDRLNQVFSFINTSDCRQHHLLSYFGQKADGWRCETCDNCNRKVGQHQFNDKAKELKSVIAILRAVQDLNGRYGKGKIAMMLVGSRRSELAKTGLDEHYMFGILKKNSQGHIMGLLSELEMEGLVQKEGSERYPRVAITSAGSAFLKKSTVKDKAPVKKVESSVDSDLFDTLIDARNKWADVVSKPTFVVCDEEIILKLARKLPVTIEEARRSGIRKSDVEDTILADLIRIIVSYNAF